MHVAELNVPVLLVVNVTVPVGVPEPVTFAVQVLTVLSRTLAGEQETAVAVAAGVTATKKVPVLPLWTLSPP